MEGMTQFFAKHTGQDPDAWFAQFAKGGEDSEGGDGLDETLEMLGGFVDYMRARLKGYVVISEAKLTELSEASCAGCQTENRLRDLCAAVETQCDDFLDASSDPDAQEACHILRKAVAAARPTVAEDLRENAPGCPNSTGNDLRETERAIG